MRQKAEARLAVGTHSKPCVAWHHWVSALVRFCSLDLSRLVFWCQFDPQPSDGFQREVNSVSLEQFRHLAVLCSKLATSRWKNRELGLRRCFEGFVFFLGFDAHSSFGNFSAKVTQRSKVHDYLRYLGDCKVLVNQCQFTCWVDQL